MSMYDEIGGAPAVAVAVSVFAHRVVADPALAHWFDEVDLERLIAHQRSFLTIALDGPDAFTGRSMHTAHAGLSITDEAYDAVAEHLAYALIDTGVAREHVALIMPRIEALRPHIVDESAPVTA
ncbi:MAG: group 1 truncated hemoglobin [Microbacterium sp.]|nr:group 1 truncated hemoglobin [Microbacterium sp.]MBA4345724.1 group 1 truncated hemoglobin [Microbacterium sp.]